jgi:hypothetical protein
VPPFATRVVSCLPCLLIAVANAALPCPASSDLAHYHVINNVGIVVEFLARMLACGGPARSLSWCPSPWLLCRDE